MNPRTTIQQACHGVSARSSSYQGFEYSRLCCSLLRGDGVRVFGEL